MSIEEVEAIRAQIPHFVYWAFWVLIGASVLTLALLIWPQSRRAGLAFIAASFATVLATTEIEIISFTAIPQVIFGTPLALYLFTRMRAPEMPIWPARIMTVLLGFLLVILSTGYASLLLDFLRA